MKITAMTRLIPLSQWNKFHVWPTTASLRRMLRKGKETGFDKVIIRVGKRIIIDEQQFFIWVKSQGKKR